MISISSSIVEVGYLPNVRGVMARLSGHVDENDVGRWIELLDRAFGPLRLAAHGFRTGLVDVVGGELEVRQSPRIVISKVAHVHHDATKMATYEAQVGCERERFFSDAAWANDWLLFDP